MDIRKKYRKGLLIASALCFLAMMITGYYTLRDSIPDEIRITKDNQEQLEDVFANPLVTWEDSIPVSGGKQYTIACKILNYIPLKEVKVQVVPTEYVQVSGAPVGIYMATDGVLIVDTESIKGEDGIYYDPAENLVQPGDYITAFNNNPINTKDDLVEAVSHCAGENVSLSLIRDNQEIELSLAPVKCAKEDYKLGIWVRDDTQGIGTLTYCKGDGNFGALGHGISDVDTGGLLKIKDGKLYETEILGIHKGMKGTPGELSGLIKYENDRIIGSIQNNGENGIFGELFHSDNLALQTMEIGYKQDLQQGPATILCGVEGEVQEYQVEISKIDLNHEDTNKSFVVTVTDERLLEKTGGIVQGMSGSPVIQNGKLVGAVTHVFVQDSTCGYGIFIENMMDGRG